MQKEILKFRFIIIYSIISLILLDKVYDATKSVIDELFHVEQGMNYCYGFYQEVIFIELAIFLHI